MGPKLFLGPIYYLGLYQHRVDVETGSFNLLDKSFNKKNKKK